MTEIPRCVRCGRLIGDIHKWNCPIRGDKNTTVFGHHCEPQEKEGKTNGTDSQDR